VSRLDRSAYDLLPLGEEDAALGLEELPEADITKIDVVTEPRITQIVESYDLGHRVSLRP
jgi:hypothetical protein